MNLIDEDFGIEMDFEELGELNSFVKILAYVEKKINGVPPEPAT